MQALTPETSRKLTNMGFLCSLFVVLIHIWVPSPAGSPVWWLYSMTDCRNIAVPFFFLMSGYLLGGHVQEDGWWKRETLKRMKSLLLPYFLWGLLWALFLFCRQSASNLDRGENMFCGLLPMVVDGSLLGLNPFIPPHLMPLWYVRSLVILVLCSPILAWALKRNAWLVLGLAFLKLFFYKGEEIGTWYYLFDRTLSLGFVFYFLLGLALRMGCVPVLKSRYVLASGLLACLVEVLFHGAYVLLGCDLDGLPRLVRFAYLRLGTVETLLWLYFIWSIMPDWKLPPALENVAFPIYLVHWFVLVGVWQYYAYEIPTTVGELLLSVFIGIFGTLLVVWALKHAFPRVSSVLFGKR